MPAEYVARWSGGRIGSGATVFHMDSAAATTGAQAAAGHIRTFFNSLAGLLPVGINVDFDAEVRVLDLGGTLTDVRPITPPLQVAGTGTGVWANGTGACIRWNTASIVQGRRLIGRTFIVPIVSSATATGNISSVARGTGNTAASTLIANLASASMNLKVWSRTHAADAVVQNGQMLERVSSLRSRNDRL